MRWVISMFKPLAKGIKIQEPEPTQEPEPVQEPELTQEPGPVQKLNKTEMSEDQINIFREWCKKLSIASQEFDLKLQPLLYLITCVEKIDPLTGLINYNFMLLPNGPDDDIYKKHFILRRVLPRSLGCTLHPDGTYVFSGGMCKFSGPDGYPEYSNRKIQKIFLRLKENGKFARVKVYKKENEVYVMVGSKNRQFTCKLNDVPKPGTEEYDQFCKAHKLVGGFIPQILAGFINMITSNNIEKLITICEGDSCITMEFLDEAHICIGSSHPGQSLIAYGITREGKMLNNDETKTLSEKLSIPEKECMLDILDDAGIPTVIRFTIDIAWDLRLNELTPSLIYKLINKKVEETGFEVPYDTEGWVVEVVLKAEGPSQEIRILVKVKTEYTIKRSLRELIKKYGFTQKVIEELIKQFLSSSKSEYNDISADGIFRFIKYAESFIHFMKSEEIDSNRVSHMRSKFKDKLPIDYFGMGKLLQYFKEKTGNEFYLIPEERARGKYVEYRARLEELLKSHELQSAIEMPSLHGRIKNVVLYSVLAQGAGKTTIVKALEGIMGPLLKGVSQDENGGNRKVTNKQFRELLGKVGVVFLERNNQDESTIKGFVENMPPGTAQIFIGDGCPTSINYMLGMCGIYMRTPKEMLDEGFLLVGGKKILIEIVEKFVRETNDKIKMNYYGEEPIAKVFVLDRFNSEDLRLGELFKMLDKCKTLEDREDFFRKNCEEALSFVKPAEQVAIELAQVIEMLKGPPTPERKVFLEKYLFSPQDSSIPITKQVKYVCGRVPKDVWHILKKIGHALFSPKDGKLADGHVTLWHHMNGMPLPEVIPENVECKVTHIVKDKETGCIGFRVELTAEIQNKNPHITFFCAKKDGKLISPVYTSEYVGSDDPSKVEVIPLNEENIHPFELITEFVY